uniref:biotin/lipoyl-containing protein n=1 Tax=Dermacoccus sp. CCH2-D9 TaxID=1768779 RepID=UPI000AD2D233
GSNFDPMLSKVIAYGPDRASALRGLDAALANTHIGGVVTNIDFCRFLLADPDVIAGRLDTGLLDARVADYVATPAPDGVLVAAASASLGLAGGGDLWAGRDGWRTGHNSPRRARFAVTDPREDASGIVEVALTHHRDGEDVTISRDVPASMTAARGDGETTRLAVVIEGEETDGTTRFVIDADGERRTYRTAISSDKSSTRTVWVDSPDGTFSLKEAPHVSLRSSAAASAGGDITSPMPGAVIAVQVADGAEVSAGDVVVIVEAMKMEHSLTAPIDGTVEILAPAGTQVAVDEVLARITPPDAS